MISSIETIVIVAVTFNQFTMSTSIASTSREKPNFSMSHEIKSGVTRSTAISLAGECPGTRDMYRSSISFKRGSKKWSNLRGHSLGNWSVGMKEYMHCEHSFCTIHQVCSYKLC